MKTLFIIIGCILVGLVALMFAIWAVIGIIFAFQTLVDIIRGD